MRDKAGGPARHGKGGRDEGGGRTRPEGNNIKSGRMGDDIRFFGMMLRMVLKTVPDKPNGAKVPFQGTHDTDRQAMLS
eukprot:12924130-Prorocentrum_lima.AAC.1